MVQNLQQDIKFIPGVGPKRAELLNKELQIFSFGDLLRYYPYKYIDRSKIFTISEIDPSLAYIQLRGKIKTFVREGKRPKERLIARFSDGTGTVDLIYFSGINYILSNLKTDVEYILLGKPTLYNGNINFVHPDLEDAIKASNSISHKFQPFYNTTEKLKKNYISSKTIQKIISTLWQLLTTKIPESMPASVLEKAHLIPLHDALFNIHFPQSQE